MSDDLADKGGSWAEPDDQRPLASWATAEIDEEDRDCVSACAGRLIDGTEAIIVIAVALGVIAPPALLFGYAATAVFLLFSGELFAVFLKAAAELDRTGPSDGMALAVVLVLLAALSVKGTWFFAALSDQVSQLTT